MFQALNDDETGEFDNFVLEVTDLQLRNDETGQIFEPFFASPLNVIISDDDSKCYSILQTMAKIMFFCSPLQ